MSYCCRKPPEPDEILFAASHNEQKNVTASGLPTQPGSIAIKDSDTNASFMKRAAVKKLQDFIKIEMESGGLLDNPDLKNQLLAILILSHQNYPMQYYVQQFDFWTEFAKMEQKKRRVAAWEKLQHFINVEKLQDDPKMKKKISHLLKSDDVSIQQYTTKLEILKNYVNDETERCDASKKLHDFISIHIKPSGMLDNIAIRTELTKILSWRDGSVDEYRKSFVRWTKAVEDETVRREARKKLHDFIDVEIKPGDLLDDLEKFDRLSIIKDSMDFSTEKYNDLLQEWIEVVNREKDIRRQRAFKLLQHYIKKEMQPGKLLDNPSIKVSLASVHRGIDEMAKVCGNRV